MTEIPIRTNHWRKFILEENSRVWNQAEFTKRKELLGIKAVGAVSSRLSNHFVNLEKTISVSAFLKILSELRIENY